ncbi:MAG: GH92 family glycosyl hydrolase, partial [Bacteroidales bacterium]|nr:GH92 family glycosyl hydrolase [Bacteroidales bacterium]
MKKILFAAAAVLMAACSAPQDNTDLASFVNPKIGTGGHGHVFVGANVPFGFVQLGPTSIPQVWDWCSGYHDSDNTVIGFSHTHLSGTGIGDLFDITVMPVIGPTKPARGTEDDPESGAWSYADRSKEITEPGYYSVPLTRYDITAELTATSRVGLHRYTFPEASDAAILFDLENGGCWDRVTDAGFEVLKNDGGKIIALGGHRYSAGWAKNQKIFFWATFSTPIEDFTVTENYYGRCSLGNTAAGQQVLVKVALSPVSVEGARANMDAELPGWDFEAVKADARTAWNQELSKMSIECKDKDTKTVFYTALYHTMIAPSAYNDVDGQYRGSDDVVRQGDFQNYTTLSLWDTYRAAQPLMTLIHPEMMNDIVKTFYRIYKEQGDLPVWHLMGNETDCMVGNPGLIVFADAVVKGFRAGLSDQEILDAMVTTANMPDRGQNFRLTYGFIPADLYHEAVANDMEYAIADAALANAAAALGQDKLAGDFVERSHSWRHYWDPETQFLRGRKTDGKFTEPFDPIYSRHET